jgi:hypothetical protein
MDYAFYSGFVPCLSGYLIIYYETHDHILWTIFNFHVMLRDQTATAVFINKTGMP